jgi:hypothetical protein
MFFGISGLLFGQGHKIPSTLSGMLPDNGLEGLLDFAFHQFQFSTNLRKH